MNKTQTTLTLDNYKTISQNDHVLALVKKALENSRNLVVSNWPVGKYVVSCDAGTVQEISNPLPKETPAPSNSTECPFCGAVICDHFLGIDKKSADPVFAVGNGSSMQIRVSGEKIEAGIVAYPNYAALVASGFYPALA